MGNSSLSIPNVQCFDPNLSRNLVTPEFWEIHSINSTYSNNALGTAIVMLLFFIVGLPSNFLVIVSIVKEKLYKESTHILLLNLAISDLLVCFLVMPFTIVTGFAGEFVFGNSDYTRCRFCDFGAVFIALTIFSANIIAIISIDRFIYIKFPLRYNQLMRVPVVITVVIVFWIVSIFESLLPVIGFGQITFSFSTTACLLNLFGEGKYTMNMYYMFLVIGFAIIPVGLIIFFNIWLACIVSKQIKAVYGTIQSLGNNEELRKYNQSLRKQIHKKRRKQLVLVKAFGAILLSNIIVWIPLVCHFISTLIVDPNLIPLGNYSFAYISLIMHSVLHPLIEGWIIPEIKSSIKTLIGITFLQSRWRIHQSKLEADDECRCCQLCSLALAQQSEESTTSDCPELPVSTTSL